MHAHKCLFCGKRSNGDHICCSKQWEMWDLVFSPLPIEHVQNQVAGWLADLPSPGAILFSSTAKGMQIRMITRRGYGESATAAWAALTRQNSRWKKIPYQNIVEPKEYFALRTPALLPILAFSEGDPILTLAATLRTIGTNSSHTVHLYMWLLGREDKLQDKLRRLFAYSTGTEKGVNDDTPNPWDLRLSLWRALMYFGSTLAIISAALTGPGWIARIPGMAGTVIGCVLAIIGLIGILDWLHLRSTPASTIEPRLTGDLLKVGIVLQTSDPQNLQLIAGQQKWKRISSVWPEVSRYSLPLLAQELAGLLSPVENSEISGVLRRTSVQDIPAPPPSLPLLNGPVKIGRAVSNHQEIGIDQKGHTLIVGGSRTGKSSAVFGILKRMLISPEHGPGLFLVDPHGSLADGFLDSIDRLPDAARETAINRLRIITPDPKVIVPLNPLAVSDFNWAGNALVQTGKRIWGDYWGPRMQAAFLALARLAHAWNQHQKEQAMGLLHTVLAAYNQKWRTETAALLPEIHRLGTNALEALLGQRSSTQNYRSQQWVTEVVSPILSKMMSLELSPWLFAALHQASFVDLEKWIQERAWVVLRLPAGQIGREGARLTAGMVYNIFEAVFRKITAWQPVPYTFVVDEVQEIAASMQLESLLSEGGKFGARMFVLTQSLSLLRQLDGFEPVVQSLLANTSSQIFFSPDPEDAVIVRQTMGLDARYGQTTIDIPSLQAWLRARIDGRWQPPTLVEVDPIRGAQPDRVQKVIKDVVNAHPNSYIIGDDWQRMALEIMKSLDHRPKNNYENRRKEATDHRQLGW